MNKEKWVNIIKNNIEEMQKYGYLIIYQYVEKKRIYYIFSKKKKNRQITAQFVDVGFQTFQ